MTQKDLDYFKQLGFSKDGIVTPVGLQLTDYQKFKIESKQPAISFIGSLDWVPNQEGLIWFLEEVWLDLKKQLPDLELHIAGRNTPEWIFQKAGNGVIVHGEVPDSKVFLRKYPLTIVPLFSGSGMRVKILEGLALSRVVVTTTLGLEGIAAQDGQEVLIADNQQAFIEKITSVFSDKSLQLSLMQKARLFIEKNYDNKLIAKNVLKKYRQL